MKFEHLKGTIKDNVERQQAIAQVEQNTSDLLYISIMTGVDLDQSEQETEE